MKALYHLTRAIDFSVMLEICRRTGLESVGVDTMIGKGEWKLPRMTEDEVVKEEFDRFGFEATFRLSDIEDTELNGKWKIT